MLRERKSFIEKKGKIILQTGYGPSGLPHIGTFGEVARTSMMVHAIKQLTDNIQESNKSSSQINSDKNELSILPVSKVIPNNNRISNLSFSKLTSNNNSSLNNLLIFALGSITSFFIYFLITQNKLKFLKTNEWNDENYNVKS